jgi:CheY-like chemotaxis protein
MISEDFRILLVEDDPILQFTFEQQMAKIGFRLASVAGDGQSAVEKVLNEEFHLVFMDVRLPILDGLGATAKIRTGQISEGKYTPIVGLTAFAHRGKCLKVGMDDFLQKPVTLEELQEVVTKWSDPNERKKLAPGRKEEPASVALEDFSAIDARLKSIKDKISKLRKKHAL